MIRPTEEFDWVDPNDTDIIVRHQPAVAVYGNRQGAVVIRQEQSWDEDSDTAIIIQRENVNAVVSAIQRTLADLGQPSVIATPPPTTPQRRTRHTAEPAELPLNGVAETRQ